MISFKKILGAAGKFALQEAPLAASAFGGPVLGRLVGVATEGVLQMASRHDLDNASKKAAVIDMLDKVAPEILPQLQAAGVKVVDNDKLADGGSALVEAVLSILKGVGAVPSSKVDPTSDPALSRVNPDTSEKVKSVTVKSFEQTAPGELSIVLAVNLE